MIEPRIHLSSHTCKKIAFSAEMHRLFFVFAIMVGTIGFAFLLMQYATMVILCGALAAVAYFVLPRFYKIKLADTLGSSRDHIKEEMVAHQEIMATHKRAEGYEKKAEEALNTLSS